MKTMNPTYVDIFDLDKYNTAQLRTIAFDLGISDLSTKTHSELIDEIRWVVENEEWYPQVHN